MKIFPPKAQRLLWLRWLVMLGLFLGLGNLDAWAVQYKYQVLHEVNPNTSNSGEGPLGKPIIASDGTVYGISAIGGSGYSGSVFKIAPDGTFSEPFQFVDYSKGVSPSALVMDKDGSFYGVTTKGGEFGAGTIFKLTPDWQLTVLYAFEEASSPEGLNLGPDGNLYGFRFVADSFITPNEAYRFKITKEGVYTESRLPPQTFSGGMVMGPDGTSYGYGLANGINGRRANAIYKITLSGEVKLLYPEAPIGGDLAVGKDGSIYGATLNGGEYYNGSFFKLGPNDFFPTVLYSFNEPYLNGPPSTNVELGEDGSLYCRTYKLSPKGELSLL